MYTNLFFKGGIRLSFSLIIFIVLAAFFFLPTLFYINLNRSIIPQMQGMMAAMAISMLVGILGGAIIGSQLQDNLFLSTVLGIFIGLISGLLVGIPISLLASLDGMLSGLMGGMMGAMLGAMVMDEYMKSLLQILFLLYVVLILTVIYMLEAEKRTEKQSFLQKIFHNPLLLAGSLSLFFFGINYVDSTVMKKLDVKFSIQQNDSQKNSDQTNKKIINIEANDFAYLPNQINVKKNKIITINLINNGKVEHDLQISGLNAEVIKVDSHQHHNKDSIHVHAQAGNQSKVMIKPLETGEFEYYCTIPGHRESGMIGTLKII